MIHPELMYYHPAGCYVSYAHRRHERWLAFWFGVAVGIASAATLAHLWI